MPGIAVPRLRLLPTYKICGQCILPTSVQSLTQAGQVAVVGQQGILLLYAAIIPGSMVPLGHMFSQIDDCKQAYRAGFTCECGLHR